MEKSQRNRMGGPEGKGQRVSIETCAQDVSGAARQGTDHWESIAGVIHDSDPGTLGGFTFCAWNMPLNCFPKAIVDDGHARRIIVLSHLHVGGGPPTPGGRQGSPWKRSQDQVPVLGANGNPGYPLATLDTDGLTTDRGEEVVQGGV